MNYTIKKSDLIYKGKVFDIKVDKIKYNSGNEAYREVVLHPGGAVVVGVTNENKIVLVKQHRYPMNKILIELPAGKLDKDEDPQLCAARELEEETGYRSNKLEKLGSIFTTPGYSSEELHIYIALDLDKGNHNREEGEEEMELLEYTLEEIEIMVADNQIVDGKTISGIFLYQNWLKKQN
jgi:ADP-ribose diphosphatase